MYRYSSFAAFRPPSSRARPTFHGRHRKLTHSNRNIQLTDKHDHLSSRTRRPRQHKPRRDAPNKHPLLRMQASDPTY